MTSINAIKFDNYSGAMVCDEQRHWNEDRYKLYGADKVIPVTTPAVMKKTGVVAVYGNTGASSIGDEIRMTLRTKIDRTWGRDQIGSADTDLVELTMDRLADLTFQVLMEIKQQHIDDELLNRFGFTYEDFCRGYFAEAGQTWPIDQPEVVKLVHELVAPPAGFSGESAVYGNKGIVAGFSPHEGFKLFSFSMRAQFYEEVPYGFVADGSGSDTVNFVLPSFFDKHPLYTEQDRIHPIDGLLALVDAVDLASRKNMGVGGYCNITLFDGRPEAQNPLNEINDHRCRLGAEVVFGLREGYCNLTRARAIFDGCFFQDRDVNWGEEQLWQGQSPEEVKNFHRALRGYRLLSST